MLLLLLKVRVTSRVQYRILRSTERDAAKRAALHPALFLPVVMATAQTLPAPFHRVLATGGRGPDAVVANALLARSQGLPLSVSDLFDGASDLAVRAFQERTGQTVTGTIDAPTAAALLAESTADGYKDDGRSARSYGLAYKIHVPVCANRSEELNATLFDADNLPLFSFRVRAHGNSADSTGNRQQPSPAWPDFDSNSPGLSQLASFGNTPTGLYACDLNSPEGNDALYGPFPVNRLFRGLRGNAGVFVPSHRNGLLLHTGEWPQWTISKPMPNSAGCLHAAPGAIEHIWRTLVGRLGVVVRNNTFGHQPYPYVPQGLCSVEEVACDGEARLASPSEVAATPAAQGSRAGNRAAGMPDGAMHALGSTSGALGAALACLVLLTPLCTRTRRLRLRAQVCSSLDSSGAAPPLPPADTPKGSSRAVSEPLAKQDARSSSAPLLHPTLPCHAWPQLYCLRLRRSPTASLLGLALLIVVGGALVGLGVSQSLLWLSGGTRTVVAYMPSGSIATAVHSTGVDAAGANCLERLSGRVEALLASSGAGTRHVQWGIHMSSPLLGELLAVRHNLSYVPASNNKLLTASATLLVLGEEHTFSTKAFVSPLPSPSAGIAICIAPGGDPSLDDSSMAALATQVLAAHGSAPANWTLSIALPRGGSVAPSTWEVGDLVHTYGAQPSRAIINENVLRLSISPGASEGAPAVVMFDDAPDADALTIDNLAVTVTPGGAAEQIAASYHVDALTLLSTVRLSGHVALGSSTQQLRLAARPAERLFAAHAHAALVRAGLSRLPGGAQGVLWVERCATDGASARAATISSPPALELLNYTLLRSDNLYAEAFLRALTPAFSADAGVAAVHAALARLPLERARSWVLADGSGLSRHNLVSPALLTSLLKAMKTSALPTILPLAGRTGTLARRMIGTAAEGRVRAKTGTMSGVSALSGYLEHPDPRAGQIVFSILANDAAVPTSALRALQDDIVVAAAEARVCGL